MNYEQIYPRVYQEKGTRAYVVLPAGKEGPEFIGQEDALANQGCLDASFVFLPEEAVLDADGARNMLCRADGLLKKAGTRRAFLWLNSWLEKTDFKDLLLPITVDGTESAGYVHVHLYENLSLGILSQTKLSLSEGNRILLTCENNQPPLEWEGTFRAGRHQITDCFLELSGPRCGCLGFCFYIQWGEFLDCFAQGVELAYRESQVWYSRFFTFLARDEKLERSNLVFHTVINPCDPLNEGKHALSVMLLSDSQPISGFPTAMQTIYGENIRLQPCTGSEGGHKAGFRLYRSPDPHLRSLCPQGDFSLLNEDGHLLCGISGTEFICFRKGDVLSFYPGFPAALPSVYGGTLQVGDVPLKEGMTGDKTTSWVSVTGKDKAAGYVSQPVGFNFYESSLEKGCGMAAGQGGMPGSAWAEGLLRPARPETELDPSAVFPLIPLAGLCPPQETPRPYPFDEAAVCYAESNIVSMVRHQKLCCKGQAPRYGNGAGAGQNSARQAVSGHVATPSGFVAELEEGRWKKLMIGWTEGAGGSISRFYFENLDDALIQAFQSANLFLVIANGLHTGELTDAADDLGRCAFHNKLTAEDWTLCARLGSPCRYGQYAGIMIVKGCPGKIYDPEDEKDHRQSVRSLAGNPGAWTAPDKFSAPAADGKPDMAQIPMVSDWLMNYCQDAVSRRDEDYFKEFARIITDPNWQGVLCLNVPAEAAALPKALAGLAAGMPKMLYIHHFGVTVNTVKCHGGQISQDKPSSVFGLLDYEAEGFCAQSPKVVQPEGGDYDFKLLNLSALFAESALKSFSCYAQLSLNRIFDAQVTGMGEGGNGWNTLLMRGSLQWGNGTSAFSLKNMGESQFIFGNGILSRVFITCARLQESGEDGRSVFGLDGVADFVKLQEMDVFSYGSEEGEGGKGLAFSGLTLTIDSAGGADGLGQKTSRMDSAGVVCDPLRSQRRSGSLAASFCLEQAEWLGGSRARPEELKACMPVKAAIGGADLTKGVWNGLKWKVNMGSMGELAGKAGLTGYLLAAWGEEDSAKKCAPIFIGFRLPGASGENGLISLQNVLKLSVESVSLRRTEMTAETAGSFQMSLNNINVKVFGAAKLPPDGAAAFYLFGPDGGTGKALGWYCKYAKQQKEGNHGTVGETDWRTGE